MSQAECPVRRAARRARDYARRLSGRPTMMRSSRRPPYAAPNQPPGNCRPDCAPCGCPRHRQLRDLRAGVGDWADRDRVLARLPRVAAARGVGMARGARCGLRGRGPWLGRGGRARAPGAVAARPSLGEPLLVWAGVFFAGDLALWHTSLMLTSVAASSIEANCAPMLVTLFAWALWGERPRLPFLLALALAFGGMLLILAPKLGGGGHALLGDALGLGTACFYAAYILAVARLRGRYGTGIVMFASTLVFTLILLPLGLLEKF